MKSSKLKKIKPCSKCGSTEFITQPNRYDIYEIMENKLTLIESPFIEDEIKLYCRQCSEELKNGVDLIN
ncbi:MAG: hypothetical protein LBP63_07305 [Prevotellaceae bacterium]|jgi:hypothetical protein|nr:hypothetical protein [Prevotellaceae bacterium]